MIQREQVGQWRSIVLGGQPRLERTRSKIKSHGDNGAHLSLQSSIVADEPCHHKKGIPPRTVRLIIVAVKLQLEAFIVGEFQLGWMSVMRLRQQHNLHAEDNHNENKCG